MLHFKFIKIFLIISAVAGVCQSIAAQETTPEKERLPRVGVIKNLKAATEGFPGNCGNHFLQLTENAPSVLSIFVASQDNSRAWMNLDGRDTELKMVKINTWYRHSHLFARVEYAAGEVRVIVSYETPLNYFDKYAARIILRKGKSARTIRSFGMVHCIHSRD